MPARPTFSFEAFMHAVDGQRRDRGLTWYALADELWQMSTQLNAERNDHPL